MVGTKKRWSSSAWALVLTVCLIVSTLAPLTAVANSSFFASGSGTEQDPYIVMTGKQLEDIRMNTNAHYKLGADLTLTIPNFPPIWAFNGSLDGNGHTIKGLHISRTDYQNAALFETLNPSAKVSNLIFEDAVITGREVAGVLAGNSNGTITNVHATGSVSGTYNIGGLVGIEDGTIVSSSFVGNVTGNGDSIGGLVGLSLGNIDASFAHVTLNATNGEGTGGLVGFKDDGTISRSYAQGTITSNDSYVGGLVGLLVDTTLEDSYANVMVSGSGESYYGGLVGESAYSAIKRSYAIGQVIHEGNSVGGLIGENDIATVENSYYDQETTGQQDTGKGEGKTTAQMKMQSTYTGWDFDTVWDIQEGVNYPTLQVFRVPPPKPDLVGSGTEEDPYIVDSAEGLDSIRLDVSAHVKLTDDIDLSNMINWEPIPDFEGNFDGDGHSITGLSINRPGEELVGLFAGIKEEGKVANLTLLNVNVTGDGYTGSLAGESLGTIENVHAEGTVVGGDMYTERKYTGGLIGYVEDGFITQSSFEGSVTGGAGGTGGLVGRSYGVIEASYTDVTIDRTGQYAGGLVGFSGGTISQSYAQGVVTGWHRNMGGLVGLVQKGIVQDSYTNVVLNGNDDNYGGLVGELTGSTVSQSYAIGRNNNDFNTSGGLIGDMRNSEVLRSYYDREKAFSRSGIGERKTTAEMFTRVTYVGWDFETIWVIEEGNGYPTLRVFVEGNPAPALEGSGTIEDPYIVDSAEALDSIRLDVNAHYKLDDDIDLSTIENWIPIPHFRGSLDGDGHIITGLNIDLPDGEHVGLFAQIDEEGKVENLTLRDAWITGKNYVGTIAGINRGEIAHVRSENGVVFGSPAGGLVGNLEGTGIIEYGYYEGLVQGRGSIGGLVGISSGHITASHTDFYVISEGEIAGGLVGLNRGSITQSFAVGGVTSYSPTVGGLVGKLEQGLIEDSYAEAWINASNEKTGGLVGESSYGTIARSYFFSVMSNPSPVGLIGNAIDSIVINSYYDTDTSGDAGAGKGEGRTTAQMQSKATYVGWDFDTVWFIRNGSDYPKLRVLDDPDQYTVSYDGNGHTSGQAPPSQMFEEGATVTTPLAGDLVRTDYIFTGWNTASDGTGTAYAIGDEFDMGSTDVTLYAQWLQAMKGDGNLDGVVTPADALLFVKSTKDLFPILLPDQYWAFDMNDDGSLDDQDLRLILEAYNAAPFTETVDTTGSVTIEIGKASAAQGEVIAIPITLQQATVGVAAYGFELIYDEDAFELDRLSEQPGMLVEHEAAGSLKLAWVDTEGGDAAISEGDELLTVYLRVKGDAAPGNQILTIKHPAHSGNLHVQDMNNRAMAVTFVEGEAAITPKLQPRLSAVPGDGSIKLSWTHIADAKRYTLFYHDAEDVIDNPHARSMGVVDPNHEFSDLENGKTYYVVLRVERASGEMVYSNVVKATPDGTTVDTLQDMLDFIDSQIEELPDGDFKAELVEIADKLKDDITEMLAEEAEVDDLPAYLTLYQKMTNTGKKLYEIQVAILQWYADQLIDALVGLEDENEDLMAEAETMKQQIQDLQDKIDELGSENENLSAQLGNMSQQVTDLQGQITTLNQKITDLENENEQLKQEKAALLAQIETLEDQIDDLNAKVDDLEGDKTAMQSIIDALTTQVEVLKSEVDDLKGNGTELQQKVAELTAQVEELQASLQQAEAFAKDLLALKIGFAGNETAEQVTSNFTLPTIGAGGTAIVWTASHDGNVSITDGQAIVTRPSYTEGDAFVTLTATLTLGDLTGTVSQLIRIVKAEPSDAEAVALAQKELAIRFAEGDSVLGVTGQLILPGQGLHGAEVTWTSTHPSIISHTGAVTRPGYDEKDIVVILTAHISRGDVMETKTFEVQVLRTIQTAQEAVDAAKAALMLELATGDTAETIKGSIRLPLTGTDGTSVTWTSSDETLISADGVVRRPSASEGNRTVTMTATITKDGVTETKTFELTILAYASGKPVELVTAGTGLGIQRDASGIRVSVEANRRDTAHQPERAVVVFQLMRGNESIAIVAFEKEQLVSERATAGFFNVNGNDASYSVKVYVYDELSTDLTRIQTSLAEVAELN
ncbi:immunoglobulin-like domain-containing protein [Paenibacillus daejeonensis]|uniref:immunoglobulin-like domain-containing protein n=1 Tax=Paenibacillus daejeonensis TaxID=135193 RepID=UPI00036E1CCA|nr:immunoglobulin-like domain-containing protein [Paenibacillus daejeonensis]